jgi:L-ribulose-5-phosphate 3-epimerase
MAIENVRLIKGFAIQPYMKAEECLEYASSHGYSYCYFDGSIHSDFAEQWTELRINNVKLKCKKFNINPIFHGNYKVPLASDVEALRLCAVEYVKKEIDVCANLSCPLIVHGGAIVEPRKILAVKKIALEALVKSLISLKDYADEKGVEIWLENLSNYPSYKPFYYIATIVKEFEFILQHVKIKLFFDFGHANVNAELPVEEFFEKFSTFIVGVSMSNNSGEIDQHLGLKHGSMNYNNILRTMIKAQWRGIIGFETRNVNPSESIKELYSIISEVTSEASENVAGFK